jgi:hypothetical protein
MEYMAYPLASDAHVTAFGVEVQSRRRAAIEQAIIARSALDSGSASMRRSVRC